MTEKIKINLGSGHWKFPGWVNVDLDRESLPQVCANLAFTLPFRSESVDLVHSEDFIDQLESQHARRLLTECHRILKPNGALRILTPDLEQLAQLYLHDQARLQQLWREHVRVPMEIGSAGEIFNLGMRFAGHTFLYDAETFMLLAAECGFDARRVAYQRSDVPELRGVDLRSPDDAISLYFDCYKTGGS